MIDSFGQTRYELPANCEENPLEDGDETLGGGHVRVTPWTPFKPPHWNPLAMHPVGNMSDRTTAAEGISEMSPKQKLQAWLDNAKTKRAAPRYSVMRESVESGPIGNKH